MTQVITMPVSTMGPKLIINQPVMTAMPEVGFPTPTTPLDKPRDDMNHVMDGLWIGSHFVLKTSQFLVKRNVKQVINCAIEFVSENPELVNWEELRQAGIGVHNTCWDDTLDAVIYPSQSMTVAINLLDKYLTSGQQVLVNCAMGKSRSCSLICAYLISRRGMDYDMALATVKRARPICQPNSSFESQLRLLEMHVRQQHGGRLSPTPKPMMEYPQPGVVMPPLGIQFQPGKPSVEGTPSQAEFQPIQPTTQNVVPQYQMLAAANDHPGRISPHTGRITQSPQAPVDQPQRLSPQKVRPTPSPSSGQQHRPTPSPQGPQHRPTPSPSSGQPIIVQGPTQQIIVQDPQTGAFVIQEIPQNVNQPTSQGYVLAGMPGMPGLIQGLPQGMPGIPQGMQGLPQGMQALPQGMQGVPQNIQGVPQNMQGVPQGMQGLPQGMQALFDPAQQSQGYAVQGQQDPNRVPNPNQQVAHGAMPVYANPSGHPHQGQPSPGRIPSPQGPHRTSPPNGRPQQGATPPRIPSPQQQQQTGSHPNRPPQQQQPQPLYPAHQNQGTARPPPPAAAPQGQVVHQQQVVQQQDETRRHLLGRLKDKISDRLH